MSLSVSGRIIKKLEVVSGVSGNGEWKKQQFVVETQEQYPKKICLQVWNEKLNDLSGFNENDMVQVDIRIESREWNERWYTDVTAWRIQAFASGVSTPPPAAPPTSEGAPVGESSFGGSQKADDQEDDLPF